MSLMKLSVLINPIDLMARELEKMLTLILNERMTRAEVVQSMKA